MENFCGYIWNAEKGWYEDEFGFEEGLSKQDILDKMERERQEAEACKREHARIEAGIPCFTEEQIEVFKQAGAKIWRKGKYYRAYFNPKSMGFTPEWRLCYSTKTGKRWKGIAGGTWNGQKISEQSAYDMNRARENYIDLVTADIKSDCNIMNCVMRNTLRKAEGKPEVFYIY